MSKNCENCGQELPPAPSAHDVLKTIEFELTQHTSLLNSTGLNILWYSDGVSGSFKYLGHTYTIKVRRD